MAKTNKKRKGQSFQLIVNVKRNSIKQEIICNNFFRFLYCLNFNSQNEHILNQKLVELLLFGSIVHITIWPSSGSIFPSIENTIYTWLHFDSLIMTFFWWMTERFVQKIIIVSFVRFVIFTWISQSSVDNTPIDNLFIRNKISIYPNHNVKIGMKMKPFTRPLAQIWTHLVIDHQRHNIYFVCPKWSVLPKVSTGWGFLSTTAKRNKTNGKIGVETDL